MARAISTRWRWPPDSVPKRSSARSVEPDALERGVGRGPVGPARPAHPADAAVAAHEHDLVHRHGELGVERLLLRARRRPGAGRRPASRPSTSMRPLRSGTSPRIAFSSVDLPDPLGPISATDCPGATEPVMSVEGVDRPVVDGHVVELAGPARAGGTGSIGSRHVGHPGSIQESLSTGNRSQSVPDRRNELGARSEAEDEAEDAVLEEVRGEAVAEAHGLGVEADQVAVAGHAGLDARRRSPGRSARGCP